MDDHFDRMLAPDVGSSNGSQRRFIRAEKFEGRKVGYAFKMGSQGIGYYHDPVQQPLPAANEVTFICIRIMYVTLSYY